MKTYLFSFVLLLSVVAISCHKRQWQWRGGGCHGNRNKVETEDASRENSSHEWHRHGGGCHGNKNKDETEDGENSSNEWHRHGGGCHGNKNKAETEDGGNSSNANTNVCSLPAVTGRCRGAIPRYYWDTKANDCLKFSYGGCDGNGNNFETKDACRAKCSPSYIDVCSLPAEAGPCSGGLARYTWDTQTKKCVTFSYGGCGGNANNFETEAECLAKCNAYPGGCKLDLDIGICQGEVARYFFNETLRGCQKFLYTGCGGNANNFNDKTSCEETCYTYPRLCFLKSEPGPCTGDKKRYFWNNDAKQCQEFSYGGCQGNENNFRTIRECNNACNTYPESCQLEPHSGPCPTNGTRYYWNKRAGECQLFSYGCLGNQNNFKTKEVCQKTCADRYEYYA